MLSQVLLTESLNGTGVQDPLVYLSQQGDEYGGFYSPLSLIQDYQDGDFRPFWFNLTMHAAHRADCRVVSQAVTLSHNIAENLENYVIGQGFSYTAISTSKQSGTDGLLIAAVQNDLDRICRDNNWSEIDFTGCNAAGTLEALIHNRSRRDGEDFIAIYSPRRGEVEFRLVNAEHVVEPLGDQDRIEKQLGMRAASSWRYGVHTADHDVQRPLGYYVQWDASGLETQYFPEHSWEAARLMRSGLMHHIKRNVDLKTKRGMSDYFPVAKQISDDAKLLRNVISGAAVQAAIAWIEQYASNHSSSTSVNREMERTNDRKQQVRDVSGGSRSEYRRSIKPGTVLSVPAGKEYKAGPMGAERNAGFGIVSELSVRRIGLRWSMPEYMISSDASNGNYSSTLVAESHFVKSRKKDQGFYAGHFRAILFKALSILAAQGYYERHGIYTIDQLRARVKIAVECPEVASRDPLAMAQANEIMADKGVLSKETWAVQAELDPAKEQHNIRKQVPGLAESYASRLPGLIQKLFWKELEQKARSYP